MALSHANPAAAPAMVPWNQPPPASCTYNNCKINNASKTDLLTMTISTQLTYLIVQQKISQSSVQAVAGSQDFSTTFENLYNARNMSSSRDEYKSATCAVQHRQSFGMEAASSPTPAWLMSLNTETCRIGFITKWIAMHVAGTLHPTAPRE